MIKHAMLIWVFLVLVCHSRQGCCVKAEDVYESPPEYAASESSFQSMARQPSKAEASLSERQLAQLEPAQSTAQANLERPIRPQYNLKRYLLKDLDLDGYTLKPHVEQWRVIRLNQLLDTLSSSIPKPTPSPIYRSGRTYPSVPGSSTESSSATPEAGPWRYSNVKHQHDKGQLLNVIHPKQAKSQQRELFLTTTTTKAPTWSQQPANLDSIRFGSAWPTNRLSNARRAQATNSTLQPLHKLGTEEVALLTPVHTSSISDYEWKRVENSRWNNLRGMWGKRDLRFSTTQNQQQAWPENGGSAVLSALLSRQLESDDEDERGGDFN